MLRHSIPLLMTFEVAARHCSFARGAAELNVTPAAVSQQVRLLEDRLGHKLFVRKARGLELTKVGRDFARDIRAGLHTLQVATQTLTKPRVEGRLRVATFHSFGLFWVLPRLPDFRERYPDVDVRLILGNERVSLSGSEADLSIRFGTQSDEGCVTEDFMRDTAIVVASPEILTGRPVMTKSADLAGFPILHDEAVAEGERRLRWSDWLKHGSPPQAECYLPDGLSVIQACLLGQGLAIVRSSLVGSHLQAGRLVRVLAHEKILDLPYRVVTRPSEARDHVHAFKEWLKEMAERR